MSSFVNIIYSRIHYYILSSNKRNGFYDQEIKRTMSAITFSFVWVVIVRLKPRVVKCKTSIHQARFLYCNPFGWHVYGYAKPCRLRVKILIICKGLPVIWCKLLEWYSSSCRGIWYGCHVQRMVVRHKTLYVYFNAKNGRKKCERRFEELFELIL